MGTEIERNRPSQIETAETQFHLCKPEVTGSSPARSIYRRSWIRYRGVRPRKTPEAGHLAHGGRGVMAGGERRFRQ